MHITLKFNQPGDVDLHHLAVLTEKSLEVLQPWCHAEHQSVALQKISEQAYVYVLAIHSSIAAAQHGYNVSNDALTMAQSLKDNKNTEEELDSFANSMMLSAQDAYTDAKDSQEHFRDVRQVLAPLIEEAKTSNEHSVEYIEGHLKPLEEGIPVFETLVKNMSEYISWWNWMEMSTKAQVENATQLKVKYGALRKVGVIKKWAELKEAFVEYKKQIERLEDTYPQIFTEAKEKEGSRSTELNHDFIQQHSSKSRRRILRFELPNFLYFIKEKVLHVRASGLKFVTKCL